MYLCPQPTPLLGCISPSLFDDDDEDGICFMGVEGVTGKPSGVSGPLIEDDAEDTKHEDQSKGSENCCRREARIRL